MRLQLRKGYLPYTVKYSLLHYNVLGESKQFSMPFSSNLFINLWYVSKLLRFLDMLIWIYKALKESSSVFCQILSMFITNLASEKVNLIILQNIYSFANCLFLSMTYTWHVHLYVHHKNILQIQSKKIIRSK